MLIRIVGTTRELPNKARRSRYQHGQALVELTLLFPLLLLLLVGAIDLGRVYYAYITITNAAREGARYGASYPLTDANIQQAAVNEAASSGFTISPSNVSVVRPSGYAPGDTITVTVSVNFSLITTYIFGLGTIHLSNSASMAILQGVGT